MTDEALHIRRSLLASIRMLEMGIVPIDLDVPAPEMVVRVRTQMMTLPPDERRSVARKFRKAWRRVHRLYRRRSQVNSVPPMERDFLRSCSMRMLPLPGQSNAQSITRSRMIAVRSSVLAAVWTDDVGDS